MFLNIVSKPWHPPWSLFFCCYLSSWNSHFFHFLTFSHSPSTFSLFIFLFLAKFSNLTLRALPPFSICVWFLILTSVEVVFITIFDMSTVGDQCWRHPNPRSDLVHDLHLLDFSYALARCFAFFLICFVFDLVFFGAFRSCSASPFLVCSPTACSSAKFIILCHLLFQELFLGQDSRSIGSTLVLLDLSLLLKLVQDLCSFCSIY